MKYVFFKKIFEWQNIVKTVFFALHACWGFPRIFGRWHFLDDFEGGGAKPFFFLKLQGIPYNLNKFWMEFVKNWRNHISAKFSDIAGFKGYINCLNLGFGSYYQKFRRNVISPIFHEFHPKFVQVVGNALKFQEKKMVSYLRARNRLKTFSGRKSSGILSMHAAQYTPFWRYFAIQKFFWKKINVRKVTKILIGLQTHFVHTGLILRSDWQLGHGFARPNPQTTSQM